MQPVPRRLHRKFDTGELLARHFFQSLNRRDGVAVLDTRDVAAQKTCALLNITLRHILALAQIL